MALFNAALNPAIFMDVITVCISNEIIILCRHYVYYMFSIYDFLIKFYNFIRFDFLGHQKQIHRCTVVFRFFSPELLFLLWLLFV